MIIEMTSRYTAIVRDGDSHEHVHADFTPLFNFLDAVDLDRTVYLKISPSSAVASTLDDEGRINFMPIDSAHLYDLAKGLIDESSP